MPETHPIPELFQSRKDKILADLSIPDAEYTDLSPKGSVDGAIRDLIGDINALPGLVTTSSCAGRISVFLEGRRKQQQQQQQQQESERQFVPSGGKGAGRWLYVSHDPFQSSSAEEDGRKKSLHEEFGMVEGDGKMPADKALRLVRFSFEPMVGYSLSFSFGCFILHDSEGTWDRIAYLSLLPTYCRSYLVHSIHISQYLFHQIPPHIDHHEPSSTK